MSEEREKLDREKEWACDYFACCLLMPERLFVKEYYKCKGDYKYLSRKFMVPKCKIGWWISELGLHDYD